MASPTIKTEIVTFLWSFISHWQTYATGGVVTGIITAWERLRSKNLSPRAYFLIFIVSFSIAGFFMAWREQFERAETLQAKADTQPSQPTIQVNVPPAQVIINPPSSDKSNTSQFVGSLSLAKVEFPPSLDANPFAVNIHLTNAGQAPIPDAYFWEIATFEPIGQISSQNESNAADKKAYSAFFKLGKRALLDSRKAGHAPTYYSVGDDHWGTMYLHPRSEEVDGVMHGTIRLYFFAYAEWNGGKSQYTACRWLQPPAEVNYGSGANLVLHDCVW